MADSIEPAHISRMRTEQEELAKKMNALTAFHAEPDLTVKLTRTQVLLLHAQLDAMQTYYRILAHRLEHDYGIWERDNAVEPNEPVVGALTENTDAVTGES